MPLQQSPTGHHGWWRPGRALHAVPLALIVAITVVDILAPPEIHLGPLLIVAPALAASFSGARATAVVAALAVAAQVLIGTLRDGLTTANHLAQVAALIGVSAFIVVLRALRDRHEEELHQVRSVSEAAQRVLLRPLPARIGPLRLASFYLAAEAEAQIGGDLYAVARTSTGTRLLVGDVRGKGLASLSDAALLLGAFRAAAHQHSDLPALAAHLDASVRWDFAHPADGGDPGESFITAVLLDLPDDGGDVLMVDCGHPPPLLLHRGAVTALASSEPAPPLGLGDLAPDGYRVGSFPFAPGDSLVVYTDGVIEARDAERNFYPLAERIGGWAGEPPAALLHQLRRDLLASGGAHLHAPAAPAGAPRLPADLPAGDRPPAGRQVEQPAEDRYVLGRTDDDAPAVQDVPVGRDTLAAGPGAAPDPS
ncbi:PP2C family protein-serine/threonine phosphatase [Kitasatospora sp. NPDC057015]|uniref:PP2C family protein-serine/threonine phosphatase n=1 Tax=Kitasatospora sp. NPDC057015 TaxID=3346001 RepID=UPI003641FAAC